MIQLAATIVCLLLTACSARTTERCEIVRAAIADISSWSDGWPADASVGGVAALEQAQWTPVQNECGATTVNFTSGRTRVTQVALVSVDVAGVAISADEAVRPGVMNSDERYAAARTWQCEYRRTDGHWRKETCGATLLF